MSIENPIEEIKNRIDIVQVIGSYIEVKPAGRNFKARCPFHGEKTASFMISQDRQTWHCFGSCNEGGDVFSFLMKYENIEFYEALKILAEKAGVELKKLSPEDQKQFGILYDINDAAKEFYKKQLQKNPKVLEYIKSRGLTEETISDFELGFAPQEYEAITRELVNVGKFDIQDIERAGLNFRTERGTYTDRFRGRIMFPISNHTGKVIGFTGRILPEYDTGETGKYINSPETAIFNKSRVLYGFHKAKNHIREMKFALLVEGQMDLLMCVQDGLKNVVATSGTALTADHLKTLKKQTDNIMFSFDNDEAGQKAAERSIDLAKNLDFNVKILSVTDYKDPADAIKDKPGIMRVYAKEAKEAMEFYFARYLSHGESFKNNAPLFKKNLHIVLEKIKALPSAVEREHWIRQLAQLVNISEHILQEDMSKVEVVVPLEMRPKREEATLQEVEAEKMRIDLIAERVLRMAMIKESFMKGLEEYAKYLPARYRRIYDASVNKETVDDPKLMDDLHTFRMRAGTDVEDIDPDKVEKEFGELLRQLRTEALKEKQMVVMRAIRQAERQGDTEKALHYLKLFDEVSKLLQN
ncbi:MAG: hypothetical protein ACD_81C00229G0003 [uncultured bacterium]|uniref:DNA primase n=1 Tax=Candidatus Wolfebacteria bacterium GW2011_GWE2_44_13 TaxID=1619017 RepID=A0A0G1JFB5_9BACT|nr:MAG: hypothetical protein ACD_81C00229G0003 [uncultured bacterium]KKT42697.1 MAG: primase protein [Candidatus Wolfebacteria bacterium GW2011_GWE2_44_13]